MRRPRFPSHRALASLAGWHGGDPPFGSRGSELVDCRRLTPSSLGLLASGHTDGRIILATKKGRRRAAERNDYVPRRTKGGELDKQARGYVSLSATRDWAILDSNQ
jgi:hypothetical protein